MNLNKRYLSVLLCSVLLLSARAQHPEHYTGYVDPFLGSYIGNTLVGANTPFGMVKPGPDMAPPNNTTGYRPGRAIAGFSHNHLSGTGGGARYGNVLITPQVGDLVLHDTSGTRYNEYARPGYYAVTLGKSAGDVTAELTATDHAAMHRYTFFVLDKPSVREAYIYGHKSPANFDANILIDATAIINSKDYEVGLCNGSEVRIVGNDAIEGVSSFKGGWGGDNPYQVYFSIRFDRPFTASGTWHNERVVAGRREQSGTDIGTYARFRLKQDGTVQLKVGMSYRSLADARHNLSELPDWDFDRVRGKADVLWNNYLQKIKVSGGTPEQRSVFYTALYHTMVMPVKLDANPSWKSAAPHYWDYYTLWDTYRTVMPLHTLILPQRQTELVNCLLDIYDHRGWLPDAWTAGDYAMMQGGTSADVVLADAIIKKLPRVDYRKAYRAMRKDATTPSDNPFKYGRYGEYLKLGYCSADVKNGSSKTLEYAYDDFCVAQAAHCLGYQHDYSHFLKQSANAFNLFDDSTGYFWAKTSRGDWVPGFSPGFRRPDYWNGPYFYEGTPYSYSFYVPHNVAGLIARHGGSRNFITFLDQFFEAGDYELGNEPGFLTPYLYNYAGRPDKTAEQVTLQLKEFKTGNIGLPGQDDSGAMSAWYVFSAMGFFPLAGQDLYLIGTPIFSSSVLELGNGKTFTVTAAHLSAANKYIQAAWLNGKQLKQAWFRHSDIAHGGQLKLLMGPEPSLWGTQTPPPSFH